MPPPEPCFEVVPHPALVPFDGRWRIADAPTAPPADAPHKKTAKERLEATVGEIGRLQEILYAHDRRAVLLIFQALDAAGKDGTIRAVLTGVNPAGCQVSSFKQPSIEELDHDFLWRTTRRLPERGRIGVFNRSYYEEVLVVRVHPALLDAQKLPGRVDRKGLWEERYASIRAHEEHLARNGTVVLKFFLHVSKEEQRRRFLARLEEPHKNWKFSLQDVQERASWDAYQAAYEEALRATSRAWGPWYAIPADDKPWMRLQVAEIVRDTMKGLGLRYPEVKGADRARFDEARAALEAEGRA